MAQIFSRAQVFGMRVALIAAVLFLAGAVLIWRIAVAFNPPIEEPIEQPVPFSHAHHVSQVGIDCRYCHTSVETSAFAGMPPTETCMTCHSRLFTDQPMLQPVVQSFEQSKPIRWNRVHDLPDFVYFNHSVHVRNGVGCVSCHGRVDLMPLTRRVKPLTMQWCLSCHRDPAPHLRPRDRVFDLAWEPPEDRALGRTLVEAYHIPVGRLTDCSVCHR